MGKVIIDKILDSGATVSYLHITSFEWGAGNDVITVNYDAYTDEDYFKAGKPKVEAQTKYFKFDDDALKASLMAYLELKVNE